MNILIVEDQSRLGQFLKKALGEHGYTGTWAATCEAAREAVRGVKFDAIVLDLGLPDGDGTELLREWREAAMMQPVLILSARDSVQDRIRGLDLGADDYLAKPFSLPELVARIRSLLRRQSSGRDTVIMHGKLRLDLIERTAEQDGKIINLTTREFALLEFFIENPGRILPRSLIAEKIWESHYDMDTNLLDVYMCKLRAKLETDPAQPLFKTVRGFGYQLL